MTASGIVFATSSNYWILLAAAILGVISPGSDPSAVLKRASLLILLMQLGEAMSMLGTVSPARLAAPLVF
ncbi:hypothetical protein LB505_003613 [Fusarium chuoi]|nr:hypothetical protein LB505_003613 [Fusarium chuoi]